MTPNEVLYAVKKMGINTSRSTLLRFEKAGVIPSPKRGAMGRGQGRYTDYMEDTPKHFFASWWTIKSEGITLKELSELLPLGDKFYEEFYEEFNTTLAESKDHEEGNELYESALSDDARAVQALCKFLERSEDYNPEDLYRAKDKIASFLDSRRFERVIDDDTPSDVYSQAIFFPPDEQNLTNNERKNIKACQVFDKWEYYYRLADSDISKMTGEIESQQRTIDYLEEENDRLKAEIEQLKKIHNA